MTTAHRHTQRNDKLPGRFEDLVRAMPPHAIADDADCENTIGVIDRLMAAGKLTKGQERYLETLVQLVEVYEAAHHPIDTSDLDGLPMLRYLMDQSDMGASDLARLLEVHPSMGSKILNGERALTIDHIRKLAARFGVGPEVFIQSSKSGKNRTPGAGPSRSAA